jgi:hypothetical protein
MEKYWSVGVMECWSNGRYLHIATQYSITPLLQNLAVAMETKLSTLKRNSIYTLKT